jgi:predicted pyridoxine 5'-phosphate oxidase superfamily flavin-nucleotide-binding protein
MVSIPKHVQDFLPGKLAWVATASGNGEPNVTPKGSLRILDQFHVLFADLYSEKTRRNLLQNNKVAITVVDQASATGYQIKGTAEVIGSGPLFEETEVLLKGAPRELPPLKYVVKIEVEAVYDQSVGPFAGRQIA